jgi:hypothetical protein
MKTQPTLAALALSVMPLVSLGCGEAPARRASDDDDPKPVADVTNHALVFVHDPITDGEPTEIKLLAPTTEDGSLQNESVNALNCKQQDGGPDLFGFATLCVEESTVKPDEDGSYLSQQPPADFTDGQDPFAQVQMYHHVNVIHDFFKSSFGFTGLDLPLDAVVNLTINQGGSWRPFQNAAFIPEQSFAAFGLPARPNGAIMFGQGDVVDFSYDASVIYHEYTHAMIGPERMNGVGLKETGLDNTAGAMNEGLADYFAATILGDPHLGQYALGQQGRDLSSGRSCPDDLTTEIHADGKIISTALWEIRETLGQEVVDGLVFRAVQNATGGTGLDEFGELVRAEAAALGSDVQAVVEPILIDHGVVGCTRIKPWVNVDFARTAEQVPHQVEGMQNAQGGFPDGVPGYHQFFVDVPAGKSAQLGWTFAPGGGFGGGEPGPLHLAINQGAIVAVSGNGTIGADAIVNNATFANNAQAITLTGSCVPADGGRVFLLFLNQNQAGDSVASMSVALVDAPATDAVTATCD